MKTFYYILTLLIAVGIISAQELPVGRNENGFRSPTLDSYRSSLKSIQSSDEYNVPSQRYFRRENSSMHFGTSISGLGFGGTAFYNSRAGDNSFLQYGSGYISIPAQTTSNIAGVSVVGSIIPMFIGTRYDFSITRTRAFTWTQYVQTGGGPLLGMEYGNITNFFQVFSKLGFRWGGGAYMGIGSEVRFNEGYAGFIQLELDAFGFLSPLAGRRSYVGPSLAFGIQKLIW